MIEELRLRWRDLPFLNKMKRQRLRGFYIVVNGGQAGVEKVQKFSDIQTPYMDGPFQIFKLFSPEVQDARRFDGAVQGSVVDGGGA